MTVKRGTITQSPRRSPIAWPGTLGPDPNAPDDDDDDQEPDGDGDE